VPGCFVVAETRKNKQETEAFQKQADELREALNNAYGFVEGQKYSQAAAMFTIEDAMDQFIERMSGSPPFRPNELERLAKVKAKMDEAIERVKNISPESFIKADAASNVNTAK